MDKEVIDKAIEFIKSSQCKYDGWDKLFEICKYIYNLEQQCKKQKEVINKIEDYCYIFEECTPRLREIIDILKEVSE